MKYSPEVKNSHLVIAPLLSLPLALRLMWIDGQTDEDYFPLGMVADAWAPSLYVT